MLSVIVLLFRIALCMSAAGVLWILSLLVLSHLFRRPSWLRGKPWLNRMLPFCHPAAPSALKSPLLTASQFCRARSVTLVFLLFPFWVVPLCFSRLPADMPSKLHPATPVREEVLPSAFSTASPVQLKADPQFPGWEAAALLWLSGGLFSLSLGCLGRFRFSRMTRRTASACEQPETIALLRELSARFGLRRCPELFICNSVSSPLLTGLLRPHIFLPDYLLPQEELRLILAHELLHLKHHDLWRKLFAWIARCFHWFNPLVWLLERELAADCELACDAAVVSGLAREERKRYGKALLHVLAQSSDKRQELCFSGRGGTSGQRELKERLDQMMNTTRHTRRSRILLALLITALCMAGTGVCLGTAPELPKFASLQAIAQDTSSESVTSSAGVAFRENLTPMQASAEQFLTQLENSADLTMGSDGSRIFSFQIPSVIPTGSQLNLQITCRLRTDKEDQSGMNIHLFEEETAQGSWIPDEIYTHTFKSGSLLSCDLYASIKDADSEEILGEKTVGFSEMDFFQGVKDTDYRWPLPVQSQYTITSVYGWNREGEVRFFNNGVNLTTPQDAPVCAAIGGTVSKIAAVEFQTGDQGTVQKAGLKITASDGSCVIYAGDFQQLVSDGVNVRPGVAIGTNSSGGEFHVEIRKKGEDPSSFINPLDLFVNSPVKKPLGNR